MIGVYVMIAPIRLFIKNHLNTSRFSLRSRLLASALFVSNIACSSAQAANILPSGATIVAGSGTVSQDTTNMTVTQTSDRMAIDWQSFSIGQGNSVTFNQPSSSSVALNRVLGSDVSVIQGALNANGHVFLVNPNGVLFTRDSQVNVGGLIASTLQISAADFMAGNFSFEGDSSNAIINQGNIVAAHGGTVGLIAAKITNEGSLTAEGGQVLMGAGRKVTLDMGGPVKLQVEQGAIDALIAQGGAIKADGGLVLLTAKAAGALATTVINHTGVTEAKTLATGEKGQIFLLGDMEHGRIAVAGTLDASAPNGGDGGFIETSAAELAIANNVHINAAAPQGAAGTWLIDPTNITIASGSCTGTNCVAADTISSTLTGGSNVTIATAAAGAEAGDITVNAPITWNANKLTLSAHNNIAVNGTMTATGSATLAFLYGQGSADGGASTYTVSNAAKIYIPAATSFTWQKGSGAAVKNLVIDNGLMRFGNGTEASINTDGQMLQPYYFDNTSVVGGVLRNAWFKLTFSNYPLDIQVASGGDGTNSWNLNGELLSTNIGGQNTFSPKISTRSLEISGYKEGVGTVVAGEKLTFTSGDIINVENTYYLAAGAAYLRTDTLLTNLSGSGVSNVRLWVGTRDDYIATRDAQFKFKGNITANGFEQIATQDTQSKALKITEFNDGQGAAVLFYSTSAGADTSISSCCSFSNATEINPRSSLIFRGQNAGNPSAEDGSYALFMRLSDLAANASDGMRWYYAAAPVAEIANVVTEVAVSAGVTPAVTPTPTPAVTPPVTAAIQTAQVLASSPPVEPTLSPTRTTAPQAPVVFAPTPPSENVTPAQTIIGGLNLVQIQHEDTQAPAASGDGAPSEPAVLLADSSNTTQDFMNVFVVRGGVRTHDNDNYEESK